MGSNVIYQYLRFGMREERPCEDFADAIAEAIVDLELHQAVPLAIIQEGEVVMDQHWIRRAHDAEWFSHLNPMVESGSQRTIN